MLQGINKSQEVARVQTEVAVGRFCNCLVRSLSLSLFKGKLSMGPSGVLCKDDDYLRRAVPSAVVQGSAAVSHPHGLCETCRTNTCLTHLSLQDTEHDSDSAVHFMLMSGFPKGCKCYGHVA